MWSVDNQTTFSADRCFVRDKDGAEIWLVAVRATFDMDPSGAITIAETQEPVALAPEYSGKPGHSSLRSDLDLPRTKLGTDVVLNGSAYAPGGKPADSVVVNLRVASVNKSLKVHGERQWKKTLAGQAPSPAKPFVACPIVYERAFGGPLQNNDIGSRNSLAEENPVGVGLISEPGEQAPQIEYTNAPLTGDVTRPAGFGAISCSWMPRRKLAGTYDDTWRAHRQPLLPDDFSDEYFYSAPQDQRVSGFLKGGEEVELTNLTPGGSLRFLLPRLSFGFTTFIDASRTHHRADLHTVLIEPDSMRLIMVWHSALPCHHTLYTLKQTVVYEKQRTQFDPAKQLAIV